MDDQNTIDTLLDAPVPSAPFQRAGCQAPHLGGVKGSASEFHCFGCAMSFYAPWFEGGPFPGGPLDPVSLPISYGAAIVDKICAGMTIEEADFALSARIDPAIMDQGVRSMADVHWRVVDEARDMALGGVPSLPFALQGVSDNLTALVCAAYVEVAVFSVVRLALAENGVLLLSAVKHAFGDQPSHLRSDEERADEGVLSAEALCLNEVVRRSIALGALFQFGSDGRFTRVALVSSSDLTTDHDEAGFSPEMRDDHADAVTRCVEPPRSRVQHVAKAFAARAARKYGGLLLSVADRLSNRLGDK